MNLCNFDYLSKQLVNEKIFSFNPQLPTVTGFLGGITFTAMILTIQFSEKFSALQFTSYSEFLIIYSAVVSFFFIIATIGGSIDQRNAPLITNKFRMYVGIMFSLGLYGLLGLIPAFVFLYSITGTIVLVVIESICIALFVKHSPGMYDESNKT